MIASRSAALGTALLALELGLSPTAPMEDGSKRPLADLLDGVDDRGRPRFTWKPYQSTPATSDRVRGWFKNRRDSIGLSTGYGDLECFEFESRAVYEAFISAASNVGLGDLVERIRTGYEESTPGGGIHWLYRCSERRGNTKLAERPDPNKPSGREVLIETRGAGGFIIIAPSAGNVHSSGGAYELVSGGLGLMTVLWPEERDALWQFARTFDEIPETTRAEAEPPKSERGLKATVTSGVPTVGIRPCSDFNDRTTWEAVLEPHGWIKTFSRSSVIYWRRPGKDHSWSATTGHCKGLKVFTTSTPFKTEGTYTKFGAYAVLNHDGDFNAATKALAEEGYGTWIYENGAEHPNPASTRKRKRAVDAQAARENVSTEQALPSIEITTDRHSAVEEAIEALSSDPEIYSRGSSLGIVVDEPSATLKLYGGVELENAKGAARFLPLSRSRLGCLLTTVATFCRHQKRRDGDFDVVKVHPPSWLIESVDTWGQWPGIRPLLTITQCPYVRNDGSIAEPGYDASVGALYRPTKANLVIPDRPTREDAIAARDVLYRLVYQFPFKDGFDFSVWLAGLLATIQRPIIGGPVPGIAFTANKAGSGKGLLIDLIGTVALGNSIPTRSYPMDPTECAKVKLSLALAGVGAVHFDNLPEGGFYGSGELDSALTSTEVSGRILGASKESGSVPLRPVWFLSGNNVSPFKDAYRRWLPCRLNTPFESPHERNDLEVSNLRQYARKHRLELLSAALIILRWHAIAGRPVNWSAPLGSFEEWDQIVRGAVWYVTENDCLETQRKASFDSPDRLEKIALLVGWSELPHGLITGHTIKEAVELAKDQPDSYSALAAAFSNITTRDGKTIDSAAIGRKFRGLRDQNHGGWVLESAGAVQGGVTKWRVKKT
jgi:Bifunctional DNA primase/polymerase, N-terminal